MSANGLNLNGVCALEYGLMAMAAAEIEAMIKEAFPDATVTIQDLAGDAILKKHEGPCSTRDIQINAGATQCGGEF